MCMSSFKRSKVKSLICLLLTYKSMAAMYLNWPLKSIYIINHKERWILQIESLYIKLQNSLISKSKKKNFKSNKNHNKYRRFPKKRKRKINKKNKLCKNHSHNKFRKKNKMIYKKKMEKLNLKRRKQSWSKLKNRKNNWMKYKIAQMKRRP